MNGEHVLLMVYLVACAALFVACVRDEWKR